MPISMPESGTLSIKTVFPKIFLQDSALACAIPGRRKPVEIAGLTRGAHRWARYRNLSTRKDYIVIFSIFMCSFSTAQAKHGRQEVQRPPKLRAQGNDQNHLFGLWKRVRGPLQTNRGTARLLPRVPSEAPEAPLLNPAIFSSLHFPKG